MPADQRLDHGFAGGSRMTLKRPSFGRFLPVRPGGRQTSKEVEAFFEAAPPHASEQLETESYNTANWLTARARALSAGDDVVAIALTQAGEQLATWSRDELALYDGIDDKKKKDAIEERLRGAMLVVDARFGGLSAEGLLDQKADGIVTTIDGGEPWMPLNSESDGTALARAARVPGFKVSNVDSTQTVVHDPQWYERFRFNLTAGDDTESSLVVWKWLSDAANEDDRSEGQLQRLDVHQARVETLIQTFADQLGLRHEYTEMLCAVARLHDEGKRAALWQRAFNAPHDDIYAKTPGPIKFALLNGYRHEFGSLPAGISDEKLRELAAELRELALHLIGAHHGFGRPVIGVNGCQDAPPSALRERAREVAFRFARMQKRWGPWGLAWWESLVRAADQRASRENGNNRLSQAKGA